MHAQNRVLYELLEPVISDLGYEFWGLEHVARQGRSLLRIYIDSADGVSLADCERASRRVTGVLDVEDPIPGGYDLEVSSPGLDRPLFNLGQFGRFIGRDVHLRLKAKLAGRRRLTGRLEDVGTDFVKIHLDGESRSVPVELIEKARLVPDI